MGGRKVALNDVGINEVNPRAQAFPLLWPFPGFNLKVNVGPGFTRAAVCIQLVDVNHMISLRINVPWVRAVC